jgi:uncharacterized membrane protein YqjE
MQYSMACALLLMLAVLNSLWDLTKDKKSDPDQIGNLEVANRRAPG